MNIEDYQNTLESKIVLITGTVGGIGFENAKFIILEIDKDKEKLQENSKIINGWILDIENCINNKDN